MVAFDPQGSTAALNAAGYMDTPEGRAAYSQATGATSYPTSVNSSSPAPTQPTQTNTSAQQLAAGINSLLGAIASGNKQAFDEAVRQFNVTSGLDQSKFDESVRQFNQNFGVTQAGLTGTYQGQQTQQAQAQAFNEALSAAGLTGYWNPPASPASDQANQGAYVAARTQQLQGMGWDQARAAQTAQSEWAQGFAQAGNVAGGMPPGYNPQAQAGAPQAGTLTQQAIAQRASIAQAWAQQYGYVPQFDAQGNPIAQAGAGQGPGGVATTLAAQNQAYNQQLGAINAAAALQANPFRQQQVLGQLGPVLTGVGGVAGFSAPNTVQGVGTQGGTGPNTGLAYMQQIIDDIKSPGANQASMQGVLDAIPTPNKINSQDFLRSAPSTQNLVLQGMQEKYGLDPQDSLAQIKNTLPQFTSPTTFGTIKG